jgi:hypothetical protein
MKFRLRRLSCLLNEKDLFKIYTEPIVLWLSPKTKKKDFVFYPFI